MLGGREGSAVALYARHPSLWTSVADRVWLVALRPRPMCSGSSPRPCGMPIWWAPLHGDVAKDSSLALCYRSRNCELGSLKVCGGVGAGHLPRAGPHQNPRKTGPVAPPAVDRHIRPAYAQNGDTYSSTDQYRQNKALIAWAQPHHHTAVPTIDRHAAWPRRAARTHRPRLHSYKPHPVGHARPK